MRDIRIYRIFQFSVRKTNSKHKFLRSCNNLFVDVDDRSLFESNVCFHSVNIFLFSVDKVIFKWQAKMCMILMSGHCYGNNATRRLLTGASKIPLYFTSRATDFCGSGSSTPQAIYCSLIRFNLIKEISISSSTIQLQRRRTTSIDRTKLVFGLHTFVMVRRHIETKIYH